MEPMDYWTVEELSQRWRVSRGFVYSLIASGRLTGIRFGRALRVPVASAAEFEAELTAANQK